MSVAERVNSTTKDDDREWVCTNDLSEYYALETDYSDGCVDWTVRDETE